ncbi:unnamed protein product [Calypogeia fissa]
MDSFDFGALFVLEGETVAVKDVLDGLADTFWYKLSGIGVEFTTKVVYQVAVLEEPIEDVLKILRSSGYEGSGGFAHVRASGPTLNDLKSRDPIAIGGSKDFFVEAFECTSPHGVDLYCLPKSISSLNF